MSLRRRLTLIFLVVTLFGLLAVNLVTFFSLRTFLYGNVDTELDQALNVAYRSAVFASFHKQKLSKSRIASLIDPSIYVEFRNLNWKIVVNRPSNTTGNVDPAPVVPQNIPAIEGPIKFNSKKVNFHILFPVPQAVTVGTHSKSDIQYRIEAAKLPSGTIIVGETLTSVNETLSRLIIIELFSSLLVLFLIGASSYYVLKRGFRPLNAMIDTAQSIGKGNISARVEIDSKIAEVDRLGSALNDMLSELEFAFVNQSRSEDNLRNFIADASHELRTPLTSIRGYSELLRNSKLDPERFDFALDRISKESNRMWRLVEDLLLLSRLDAGRPLDQKDFDLVTLVAEAVLDFQVSFPNYPVEMNLPNKYSLVGDVDRWRQVISNLLNNVAVHTPDGTKIEVSVASDEDTVLKVKDDGPGMTQEQIARLFDRFYRSIDQKVIQDDYSSISLGLGMAIVKAIINAHGMKIAAESKLGHGTEFRIYK